MPDTVTLRVEGLATIDAALRELPKAVQEEVLGAALGAAGEVLRRGIAEKIHDRTGRTAADLRVEVQVKQGDVAGVAAVGGGPNKAKTSRTHILRFLEFGTKPHVEPKKGRTRRAGPRKRLAFGGKVFSRVQHPGTHAQAPMRQAIAEDGPAAIKAFTDRAWAGIVAAVERLGGKR